MITTRSLLYDRCTVHRIGTYFNAQRTRHVSSQHDSTPLNTKYLCSEGSPTFLSLQQPAMLEEAGTTEHQTWCTCRLAAHQDLLTESKPDAQCLHGADIMKLSMGVTHHNNWCVWHGWYHLYAASCPDNLLAAVIHQEASHVLTSMTVGSFWTTSHSASRIC